MKAILTKPEKKRLLEQFEKSGKTHAQFAEENGLNVKTLSKWIYEWHHQIKTTNEVKFVEIKTTAISSVNDIRIKKSGMEILIPADLEQYQLKNIPTVLASKGQHHRLSALSLSLHGQCFRGSRLSFRIFPPCTLCSHSPLNFFARYNCIQGRTPPHRHSDCILALYP